MKLSQELVDIIIDMFDDCPEDLHNCSLVCRSWVHSSRRHLFRRVRWALSPHGNRHRHLLSSPHISTYIQEVDVHHGHDSPGSLLPLALDMLSNLTKIKLDGLDWSVLPQNIQQSIYRVLELPSITSFAIEQCQFYSMDDLGGLLSHAKGLTCLSITEITLIRYDPLQPPTHGDTELGEAYSNHRQMPLLDFHFKNSPWGYFQVVDWLLGPRSPLEVSHVRALHVRHGMEDAHTVNKLLYAIGSSLRHLELKKPYWGEFVAFFL